jgi:threonine synthase
MTLTSETFVTRLECSLCGTPYEAGKRWNLCTCGGPLLVLYDLRAIRESWSKKDLLSAPKSLWRYAPILPVPSKSIVTLGEGMTPLLPALIECKAYGANVTLVDGLISDCAKIVMERGPKEGWFDLSTLKEPYRVEGKKTMGYEIAEQLDWELPDAIFYPAGGGVGMIGMWKAFDEMESLGWIGSKRPKMIAVQAEGCQPIVRAFNEAAGRFPGSTGGTEQRRHRHRDPRCRVDRRRYSAGRRRRHVRVPRGRGLHRCRRAACGIRIPALNR